MDKSKLIELIREAFDGVSREGGISLHETQVIDMHGTDIERAEARKKDKDRQWQNVWHEDLAAIGSIGGIAFLDPIGWKYYLPAYLTWLLTDPTAMDSVASEYVFYSLVISRKSRKYDSPRFESLDLSQKQAVKAFLEYVSVNGLGTDYNKDDANKALANYWKEMRESF